ncbi:MAG: KH domain-containing protein [Candidatus Moranbacteria bacterium]|nr:KH domain-containing protein [Candidatus Moranbacteria bacterium]
MTEIFKDQEFIEYVVKALVDHPDDVKVARKVDEMGVLITLDVHPEDMGMVIGREGMTAKSLRTLLRVIGAKNNARVNLKINEPEGSTRGSRREESVATPGQEPVAEVAAPVEQPKREEPKPETKRTLDDVMNDIQL